MIKERPLCCVTICRCGGVDDGALTPPSEMSRQPLTPCRYYAPVAAVSIRGWSGGCRNQKKLIVRRRTLLLDR